MTQTALVSSTDSSLIDQLRARLRDDQVELPVLPASAQEVLRMTADPNTNGKALATKISGDPAMSAHVLRIANSALYAGSFTLTSIRQAVGRLGMELIGQIAATVAVQSSALDNRRYQEELARLWQLSLRRGLCARELARLRRDSIEHAFLGGLLRDLGQACVYRELDRMGKKGLNIELDEAGGIAMDLGYSAGAALARKWELADELAASMSAPCSIPDADATSLTIELAHEMATSLQAEQETFVRAITEHPAASRLALGPEAAITLWQARERIEQSASAMS